MHEMPVVMNVVEMVDDYARNNDVKEVRKVIMEIGQIAMVMPHYFRTTNSISKTTTEYVLSAERWRNSRSSPDGTCRSRRSRCSESGSGPSPGKGKQRQYGTV